MKVYQAYYTVVDGEEKTFANWFASERQAREWLVELRDRLGDIWPDGVRAINIPETRSGLLSWLNKNVGEIDSNSK